MRLRHLAMALSRLPPHPQQHVTLEQYATGGDFAARWIAEIMQRGDLDENTRVVDLGAGNGILGIGCHLAGAKTVLLVEKDADCQHEYDGVEWLIDDISAWSGEDVDLVIMNPPWGVQIARADRAFLLAALNSEAKIIHLLHSARATHIHPLAQEQGWSGEVILSGEFRLPARYGHHTSRDGMTAVSVWRLSRD